MQLSPNNLVLEDKDVFVTDLVGGWFDESPGYRVFRRYGASTWLLFMTWGGSGRIVSEGQTFEMGPGKVFMLEPRVMHEYLCSPEAGRWQFGWVHFWPRHHWGPLMEWKQATSGLRVLPLEVADAEAGREAELWREMVGLTQRPGWLAQMDAMARLELIFISLRSRIASDTEAIYDPRVEEAIAYLREHLQHPIGVKEMAGACGLSSSRFTELFRTATGSSPRDFLERERIFRARHLLSSTRLSIREVARQAGFESEFYFSTRFKKLSGRSPSVYRAEKHHLGV
jgi:AraC family transcriptional regulator of arabinose operon